jgi:EAL domain-containing protein (putative c-di-GMP-specific phosphodiesterase class I)
MTSDTCRLLGFAFANADFLLEIAPDGRVLFAAGATAEFTDRPDLVGSEAKTLFEPQDGARFASEARTLQPGGRLNLRLKLQAKRPGRTEADVALFRLPENEGRISCTLAAVGKRMAFPVDLKDGKTGLAAKESFLTAAMEKISDSDALTLVNMPGLPKICADLPAEKADALLAAIGQSFKNSGAKAAGRLSETSFGALADAKAGPKSQIAGVRAAMAKGGVAPTEIQESHVSMKGPLRPEQKILALRYVVDLFTSSKRHGPAAGDIVRAFESMMDETHDRLAKLTDTVAAGAFDMAYQPIVDLKTQELSHFEALARFGPGQTGETVAFVEKLGISDSFDLAVAMKVIGAMEKDASHAAHVAFNVSGHTIQTPAIFGILAGLLARHKNLPPRLLIEITETAEITDMAAAAKAMQALREMGFRVGLDDFGSGAATLNYLQAFHVDFVKFDGTLVKKLGASARDDTMLKAMLKLCHELGFTTIAEYLETEDDVARARDAGFDHGQGYFFGAAGKIPAGAGMKKSALKRKGVSESWE